MKPAGLGNRASGATGHACLPTRAAGNVFLSSRPVTLTGKPLSATASMTLNATISIASDTGLTFNYSQASGGTGANRHLLASRVMLTSNTTTAVHGENDEIGRGNLDNGGTKKMIDTSIISADLSGGRSTSISTAAPVAACCLPTAVALRTCSASACPTVPRGPIAKHGRTVVQNGNTNSGSTPQANGGGFRRDISTDTKLNQ